MEYKRQYRDLPDEVKQKISASTKGRAKSYDHKQHISQGMKKYWWDEEILVQRSQQGQEPKE